MTFTDEEKFFCVKKILFSCKTVQTKFRRQFSFNMSPTKSAIHQWVCKFKAT